MLSAFSEQPGRRGFTRQTSDDYTTFAASLADHGFDELLSATPLLAGLLDQVVDTWCNDSTQFIVRLERDRAALREHFGLQLPIVSARPVVRTAYEIGGEGATIVYKARSVAMDGAFAALVGWLNSRLRDDALHVVRIIERPGYGWMEHVPHRPTRGPGRRDSYHVRSGILLCLVHAIGGGDLHAANIRCTGAHPVIVDAEVLLRPRRAGDDDRDGPGATVVSSGWLPVPGEVDRCGLAAEHYGGPAMPWVDVATDGVRPRPQSHSRGRVRAKLVDAWASEASDVVARLSEGFSLAYQALRRHGLPLEFFADTAPRVLLRSSNQYGDAIERSLSPAHLKSESARSRAFEWIDDQIPPSLLHNPDLAARAAQAERLSMQQLEIPRFDTPATERTLRFDNEVLGTPFDESPLERACRLLAGMSPAAEAAQRDAIAKAVHAAASGSFDAVGVRFELLDSVERRAWSFH
ncbi:MAG: type 2 lanthipeptide synthetase LanM [Pseudomonadota bacterium]